MSAWVCIETGLKKESNSTELHCAKVISIKVNHIGLVSLDQQYQLPIKVGLGTVSRARLLRQGLLKT